MSSSDSQAPEPHQPIHSSHFWYKDGNLILQAENTQFRVHKSILAAQSPVFRDMFSLPQATIENPSDPPVVVLEHDSSVDWELFLSSVYNGFKFIDPGKVPPFAMISSAFRLGKKYQCRDIFESALGRLRSVYPPGEWESLTAEFDEKIIALAPHASLWDVVNLAVEYGLQKMLSKIYLQALMQGAKPGDLVTLILEGMKNQDGAITRLSSETQRVLLKGRDRLHNAIISKPLRYIWNSHIPVYKCTNSVTCTQERDKLLRSHLLPELKIDKAFALPVDLDQFCYRCAGIAEDSFVKGQKVLIASLPEMFGLPPWDEMKDYDWQDDE
ncbi:hypothetical protein CC1G_12438 [Coprinopsis cinerea okayama7|uniref:BTB domain-containing protein n=1 Tax=Coprinopsis cinerea (strain Okayama-7 / 130 / ATCC MYA-4618 / FGSC 9003) TaxID=240176 RepID=A8NSS9_COPC7|nr:hypothetical protein CC1G_12438 [Coprinopsis cinerea okayama7\|eukprot:XP_001836086.2 hypothetical protein CC1G_12438 [Coprinopsis cinerea okayama7\